MTYSKWSGNVEVWGLEGLEGGNILMNVLCETVESTVWLCPWEGIYSAHGQSCRTLWDPMDCSPPGSSVHRILQARMLEWVVVSSFMGSSWPTDRTWVSYIAGRFFTVWATKEAPLRVKLLLNDLAYQIHGEKENLDQGALRVIRIMFSMKIWFHICF